MVCLVKIFKVKISKAKELKIKQAVRDRADRCCECCGVWLGQGGEVHHIIFRSAGGTWDMDNLTYICGDLKNCIAHWRIHQYRLFCRRNPEGKMEFSVDKFEDV